MVTVSHTGESGSTTTKQKPLPLLVKKAIKERYDPEVEAVLNSARKLTGDSQLEFQPNFAANYQAVAAFDSTLDRTDGEDDAKLSEYWIDQFGQATLSYFEGLVEQLRRDNFKGDQDLQEAFQSAVGSHIVEVQVVTDKVDGICDCVLENEHLVIRTTVENWFVASNRSCEGLMKLL